MADSDQAWRRQLCREVALGWLRWLGMLWPITVAQALVVGLSSPVLPEMTVLARSLLVAPLCGLELLLVVGLASAVLEVGVRWTEDGSLTALALVGRDDGAWRRALWPVAVAALFLGATASLVIQPAAQRHQHRLMATAAASLDLWPGRRVHAGPLDVVRGTQEGRLWLAAPSLRAVARDGALEGGQLKLEDVVVHLSQGSGAVVSARRLRVAVPLAPARIPLGARGSAELFGVAKRTRVGAGDYEWAVLFKRGLGPIGAALWVWLAAGLAARPRPWQALCLALVGWIGSVRVGDALAPVLGAGPSALSGDLLLLALLAALHFAGRRR